MDRFVDLTGIESSSFMEESEMFDWKPSDAGAGEAAGAGGGMKPADATSGGVGGGVGKYLTPENVAAGAQVLGAAAGLVSKTDQQKNIKTACGRRPLIGKKRKATYQACVDSYMAANSTSKMTDLSDAPPEGSSTTKIIIYSVIALVVVILVIVVVIKLKKK